jgi:hypothetical protein
MTGNELIKIDDIKSRIFTIRGMQVMLDRDIAELYDVQTKVLNQAVKRNRNRFPERLLFMLSDQEKNELVTNCDRLRRLKHSSSNPYVFTEQGVAMLSAVLKSEIAVDVSIKIMDAFILMRHFISENLKVFQRFEIIEKKQIEYQLESDKKFDIIFEAMEKNRLQTKQGIFFEGQVFEAHKFVSDIVRSAEKSIILIDNYVDDTVLTLFSKRKQGVMLKIFTKNLSKQLQLDTQKFNEQFPPAEIKEFNHSHDRFMIIDDRDLYHFGASLKDLGKKWFGFSKMDVEVTKMLARI